MHHANHFYGHAAIMARYAGLAEVPAIRGYLQHGWNLHDGFAVGTAFAPGYPKLVWSDVVARRAWAAGLRDLRVVAAPWAYLVHMDSRPGFAPPPLDDSVPRRRERAGTIVYPFHGWEGQKIVGSHAAYAAEVRAIEGDVPITMCLYWHEHDDPAARGVYEDAGFRVISHGRRGHMWRGTDPLFLYRQLEELHSHERVVSNRLGSALLYGASLGAEIGVYGDPMVLRGDHRVLGGMHKQLRLYPELHRVRVAGNDAAEVARTELGLDRLLPAAEVRRAFGWDEPDLVAG